MEAVNCTTFRANLRSYLDKTRDDAEPILVTSNDPDASVVVINVRDWDNIMENEYVRSNRYLYEKLLRSRERLRKGELSRHGLLEPEDAATAWSSRGLTRPGRTMSDVRLRTERPPRRINLLIRESMRDPYGGI